MFIWIPISIFEMSAQSDSQISCNDEITNLIQCHAEQHHCKRIGLYVIKWASMNGRIDVIELLMTDPIVKSSDKEHALIWAAKQGYVTVVEILLQVPDV